MRLKHKARMASPTNIKVDRRLRPKINFFSRYTRQVLGSTFGENVRRFRKAAGLKSVELARRLKVTPPVVSAWEKNRTGLPEAPTLLKIARALGVTVNDLLDGVDKEHDAIALKQQAQFLGILNAGIEETPEGARRLEEALRKLDSAHDQREIARVARTIRDLVLHFQLKPQLVFADDTIQMARWFESLTPERRRSILDAFDVAVVHFAAHGTAKPRESVAPSSESDVFDEHESTERQTSSSKSKQAS
jgi:transcriptional regulator with XRE-family HTH domain